MRSEIIEATKQLMINNYTNPNLPEMVVNFVLDYKPVKQVKSKIGLTFGNWIVESNLGMRGTHQYYLCRCSCGHTKEVADSNLSSGKSKSCGQCNKIENEPKEKELVVIWPDPEFLALHNETLRKNNQKIVNKYNKEVDE